jgi:hypothetical protein
MCAISNRLRQEKRISHMAADATPFVAAGEDFTAVSARAIGKVSA